MLGRGKPACSKVDPWKQLHHVMMRTNTFLKAISKLYVQVKLIQTNLNLYLPFKQDLISQNILQYNIASYPCSFHMRALLANNQP